MMHRIGFVGAWSGLTVAQLSALTNILKPFGAGHFFHHGDNIGGDEEAHAIATHLKFVTIVHPQYVVTTRAFCKADSLLPQKSGMLRYHDIVKRCDFFLGFPDSKEEVLRSEVWMVIRHAHVTRKRMTVIGPTGDPIER